MSPDRALHRDTTEDIEGLAHRGRIILPDVILPDGTASLDQVAIVPPGVKLTKAALPWRELPGPPTRGPGAAIVGTREPDHGPYLPGAGTTVISNGGHSHITRPQSRNDILAWLYDITGLRYAPAALWRVAGWEIGWLATWLDRLLVGGVAGELIIAERQAATTVRAAWLAHKATTRTDSSLVDTGVLLAGRAVIDMLAAFERVIASDPIMHASKPAIADAEKAIVQRLRSFIRAIEEATTDRMLSVNRHIKIGNALDHARELVDNIGLFSAVSGEIGKRVVRVSEALPTTGRKPPPLTTTFVEVLDGLSIRLERVIAAGPALVTPKQWCPDMIGELGRLDQASFLARGTALGQVRTDLIYKLLVTRRLDRVFKALPWMAAPSGAFRLTFGGPLGAMAAMVEIARYREIAVELCSRTYEPESGARLDTTHGEKIYSDPAKVQAALRSNSRAGVWLATSALSHHMVKAFLAGRPFNQLHPLPILQGGNLSWQFEQSMRDPATMTTVTDTERAKSIYATADYHRDIPRYMGLTVDDVLTLAIVDGFPGEFRDPGYNKFVKTVDQRRESLGIGANPFAGDYAKAADRELLRSILKSLDEPSDGNDSDWRPDSVVTRSNGSNELRRFDNRNIGHTGDRGDGGGRVRPRGAQIRKAQKDPSATLRRFVNRARSWTNTSNDRFLAKVLSKRSHLTSLVPVAQTGVPAIWFHPALDTPIHDWIADGAPMWRPIALSNIVHAGLIAREVQTMATAMPLLFGIPIPAALRCRILVPLWTGLAAITEDHAHVG